MSKEIEKTDDDSCEVDFSDLVLHKMGATMSSLCELTGVKVVKVELGHGIDIAIQSQDAGQKWRDRMCAIIEMVDTVCKHEPRLDRYEALSKILDADGWSSTTVSFRAPIWLIDHTEMSFSEAISEFEDLEGVFSR